MTKLTADRLPVWLFGREVPSGFTFNEWLGLIYFSLVWWCRRETCLGQSQRRAALDGEFWRGGSGGGWTNHDRPWHSLLRKSTNNGSHLENTRNGSSLDDGLGRLQLPTRTTRPTPTATPSTSSRSSSCVCLPFRSMPDTRHGPPVTSHPSWAHCIFFESARGPIL